MTKHARTVIGLLVLAAFVLTAVYWWAGRSWLLHRQGVPPSLVTILQSPPKQVPAFRLGDQNGKVFDRARLRGHWTFMFFGYTSCPDVCPTTLATLRNTARRLDQAHSDPLPQFVFVTVDPQRDTPKRLGQYVTQFDPRFIGATGNRDQLKTLKDAFHVVALREPTQANGNYEIMHTASLFLVDPKAELYAIFPPPLNADTLANLFQTIKRYYQKENPR